MKRVLGSTTTHFVYADDGTLMGEYTPGAISGGKEYFYLGSQLVALVKSAGGKARSSGNIVVDGERSRAKELFREFNVKGVGERTIVSEKTGGGRGVAGELGD